MNPEVNETQPKETQDDIQLTNDELAAAMGYMTTLGDQDMMAQMSLENGSENAQDAPGKEQTPETAQVDPEALKNEILEDIKKEVKNLIKTEIKKLLDEDDEDEQTKTTTDTE